MERLYRQLEREHDHARAQQLVGHSQEEPDQPPQQQPVQSPQQQPVQPPQQQPVQPPQQQPVQASQPQLLEKPEYGSPKHEPFDQGEQQPVDGVPGQLPEVKAEQGVLCAGPSSKRRRSQPQRLGCHTDWYESDCSSDDEHKPSKKPRCDFVCEFCDESFPFKSKLERHVVRSHTGQRVVCPSPKCVSWMAPESLERHWKRSHSQAGFVSVPASFSLCGACGLRTVQDCGCVGESHLELEDLVSLLAASLDISQAWYLSYFCTIEN